MAFTYGTRSAQYIVLEDADENDRIEVTLQNGQIVTLRKACGERSYRDLEIDRERTDPALLETLYQHIMERERKGTRYSGWPKAYYAWRYRRDHPATPLEVVREQAQLEVSVNAHGDSFDNSPRVGERLDVMPTLPDRGGTVWHSAATIRKVTFYSLDPTS